jgi:hypothetical protein
MFLKATSIASHGRKIRKSVMIRSKIYKRGKSIYRGGIATPCPPGGYATI